ncbi:MAG: hypothetical protein HHJ12_11230 [Glaciimonas sp.]|nr:hypothetical protein [Glaciimonas sp.]
MKLYKQACKYGRQSVVVVSATALALASSVASAVGIDISAATATATTDIGTAGGLIIGVMVAVAAVAWIRRVVH